VFDPISSPSFLEMRAAAQERGVVRLARELGTNRISLANYFAGVSREGTVLLLESRFRELVQAEAAPAAPMPPATPRRRSTRR
jgi:hypothetical protein